MSSTQQICSKIQSVGSIRKVTRALQMVSAVRIRHAQQMMRTSRPYALHMRRVVMHIAQATPELQHPALHAREARHVCYVVIATDRGLCGSLNHNLFRKVLEGITDWRRKGATSQVVAIGQSALQFCHECGLESLGAVTHLGDRPELKQLTGVMKIAGDTFMTGRADRLLLAYSQFMTTMGQRPIIDALLPLPAVAEEGLAGNAGDALHPAPDEVAIHRVASWDYVYEPEPEAVLEQVLRRYYEASLYHAVLENLASEHAARMVAMRAASDNADRMIRRLTLAHNKARQEAITEEITEIVAGADAIKG